MEEQEKLAVAIRVDEKKDLVIEKVTDAWKKMVDHWKQIEEQRHAASQALITERAVTKRSQEEINKVFNTIIKLVRNIDITEILEF